MIYLASPYSHPDPFIMRNRFLLAEETTACYTKLGVHVYSPIVHYHELAAKFNISTDFDFWQKINFDMIRRADDFWILDIPGWRESKGVTAEYALWRSFKTTDATFVMPISEEAWSA